MRLPTPRPTLVVFEAVLFYLSPPAKAALLREAAALLAEGRRDAPRCTREMYRDLAEMPLPPHTRVHDTSTTRPTRPPTIPAAGHPASELALTDNLAPFLRSADRKDADDYFGGSLGLQLRQHETLWGGAIQFARAGAKSGE